MARVALRKRQTGKEGLSGQRALQSLYYCEGHCASHAFFSRSSLGHDYFIDVCVYAHIHTGRYIHTLAYHIANLQSYLISCYM